MLNASFAQGCTAAQASHHLQLTHSFKVLSRPPQKHPSHVQSDVHRLLSSSFSTGSPSLDIVVNSNFFFQSTVCVRLPVTWQKQDTHGWHLDFDIRPHCRPADNLANSKIRIQQDFSFFHDSAVAKRCVSCDANIFAFLQLTLTGIYHSL